MKEKPIASNADLTALHAGTFAVDNIYDKNIKADKRALKTLDKRKIPESEYPQWWEEDVNL